MSQRWIIVYPGGDKSTLDMALACGYEYNDYMRASRRSFEEQIEAKTYGRNLAKDNNLNVSGELLDPEDHFLD